jgi:hypothetical protein
LPTAPPHALEKMTITVPIRNKCLFPHILPEGTKKIAATPTPSRKYPVKIAIFVNASSKCNDKVKVLAARIGPREVAKIETTERMRRIISRFHRGQFCEIIVLVYGDLKRGFDVQVDR